MKKYILGLMTVAALFTTACQKNNGGSSAAPVYPTCAYGQYTGCTPGVVGNGQGSTNYGGNFTQNYMNVQGNFQVSGNINGPATISGTIVFTQPWLCGNGMNLMGALPITMAQQGQLVNGDAFVGYIMLGGVQAYVQVIPGRTGYGNFAIASQACGLNTSFNF